MCRHGDDFVPGGCSTTTFQLAVRSDGGATKAAATENLRMGQDEPEGPQARLCGVGGAQRQQVTHANGATPASLDLSRDHVELLASTLSPWS